MPCQGGEKAGLKGVDGPGVARGEGVKAIVKGLTGVDRPGGQGGLS